MGGKGGGKGGSAPAPDPNIGYAALLQAQTGEKWLAFAEEQFAVGNERQKGIDALTNQVTQAQLDTMNQSNSWAKEDRGRYKSVFQPMEDKFIDEANNWDSAARQDKMAAEAKADVLASADQQRQASTRQLSAMGINPASGRFAGVNRAGETATALNAAGAQNQARNTVRTQGMALRADAINMGKGMASQAAGAAGLGLNAGNSVTGNAANANNQWRANQGVMAQGYQGAMQGYAGQASTLNSLYGNQLQGWSAQQQLNSANAAGLMSGIGTMAGLGIAAFSSKDYKEDKRPIDGALDAVNSMPVERWKYKDGISDGGEHIGPYAEDFQKATGAGDGKTINLVDGMGITMKAVQELSEKVDKLAVSKGMGIKREARA